MKKIITGFSQILTLKGLSDKGALQDDQLEIIKNGAIAVDGEKIQKVGLFDEIYKNSAYEGYFIEEVEKKSVAIPGFVDCHTHVCFAGDRKKIMR